MNTTTTKQFYIGLIAFDKDRAIALEVLPALEEELNRRIDLLSLNTPLRSLYVTINLTGNLKEPVSKIEDKSLQVELPIDAEGLDDAQFEKGVRNRLSEVLSRVPEVPGEVGKMIVDN